MIFDFFFVSKVAVNNCEAKPKEKTKAKIKTKAWESGELKESIKWKLREWEKGSQMKESLENRKFNRKENGKKGSEWKWKWKRVEKRK